MPLPYRMTSDSWQPARLRRVDHEVVMTGLVIVAFLRALDYLIGSDTWGAKDFMIAAAPEWVWGGVGFLAGGLILSFGVATKKHLAVYIGHGWLATAYGLNAIALVLASGPEHSLLLVSCAALSLAGLAASAHKLAQKGRGGGLLAFLLIVSGTGLAALGMSLTPGSFDGARGGGAVGLVAIVHLIYMIRTGGRPLRISEGTCSEKVVDGGNAP